MRRFAMGLGLVVSCVAGASSVGAPTRGEAPARTLLPGPAPGLDLPSPWWVLFVFVLMVAVAVVLIQLLKRFGPAGMARRLASQDSRGGRIRVVDTLRLPRSDKTLYLLEADGQRVLLSEGRQGSALAVLPSAADTGCAPAVAAPTPLAAAQAPPA